MPESRPNLVLVVTDQERDGGDFETSTFSEFRKMSLVNHHRLASQGVTFTQHRCSSAACVPSRASLFTGLSPLKHGVCQTDGFAKLGSDPKLVPLDPVQGPRTLGHRFQALGYDTAYIGKWHLSHIDHNGLEPFGFGTEWKGPEPHGADPSNSGLERDDGFVTQAIEYLEKHRDSKSEKPFLLVVCLVNPHDIVLWPSWWLPQFAVWAAVAGATAAAHWSRRGSSSQRITTAAALAVSLAVGVPALRALSLNLGPTPDPGPGPTEFERPKASDRASSSGPAAESEVLGEYRRFYFRGYGTAWFFSLLYRVRARSYRRTYLKLLELADKHLGKLLDAVDAHEKLTQEKTAVVFTSDHGELLGAHGGLHQKWYNAFEETVRVPLMIRAPWRQDVGRGTTRNCTCSHLDLVPTLLSLAGGSKEELLPGRDVLALRYAQEEEEEDKLEAAAAKDEDDDGTYFLTLDHVFDGSSREATAGRRFPILGTMWPMRYPPMKTTQTAVEALVVKRHGRKVGAKERFWKVVRTFDPDDQHPPGGSGHWCLFDLTADPGEKVNLVSGRNLHFKTPGGEDAEAVFNEMRRRLAFARRRHGGALTAAEATEFCK